MRKILKEFSEKRDEAGFAHDEWAHNNTTTQNGICQVAPLKKGALDRCRENLTRVTRAKRPSAQDSMLSVVLPSWTLAQARHSLGRTNTIRVVTGTITC